MRHGVTGLPAPTTQRTYLVCLSQAWHTGGAPCAISLCCQKPLGIKSTPLRCSFTCCWSPTHIGKLPRCREETQQGSRSCVSGQGVASIPGHLPTFPPLPSEVMGSRNQWKEAASGLPPAQMNLEYLFLREKLRSCLHVWSWPYSILATLASPVYRL